MKIRSSLNLPRGHMRSHKKFGPIGSTVLTFIGYKLPNIQADTQTNKQSINVKINEEAFFKKKCRLKLLNYSLEIFQFGFQIHNSPPCIKQVSERKWGIHFLYFLCLKQISIGKMDIYIFVYLMYIKQLLNSFFEINLSHLKGELMDK